MSRHCQRDGAARQRDGGTKRPHLVDVDGRLADRADACRAGRLDLQPLPQARPAVQVPTLRDDGLAREVKANIALKDACCIVAASLARRDHHRRRRRPRVGLGDGLDGGHGETRGVWGAVAPERVSFQGRRASPRLGLSARARASLCTSNSGRASSLNRGVWFV